MNETKKECSTTTEVMEVTPALAEEWLKHNIVNRTVRGAELEKLVRDMKNGCFVLTHQGIAFNEDGDLIDGQHRLMACALSGVTIRLMVTRYLPNDAATHIDNGAKRTFADAIKFSGAFAGNSALTDSKSIGAVRSLVRCGYKGTMVLSNDELGVLLSSLEDPIKVAHTAMTERKKNAASAPVYAAAVAAIICGESGEDIKNWLLAYTKDGVPDIEGYNLAAAFQWQRYVFDAKLKHQPLSKEVLYRGTQNSIWQFIHGGDTKYVRVPKKDRYPVAMTIAQILEKKGKTA